MSDDYTGVMLEDIQSKLQGIAEAVGGIQDDMNEVKTRLIRVESLSERIPAIEAAVTDQSRQLEDHEARISHLEAA